MKVRLNLERAGSRLTRLVGIRWGESFPFYYVIEYPKSGGSWLADMLADYLQIARPVKSVFPVGCEAVVQAHWSYTRGLKRVFYLYRDGRDVVVSLFFRITYQIKTNPRGFNRSYFERRFPSVFGASDPAAQVRTLLPRFVEEWSTRPAGSRLSWAEHVRQWTLERPGVAYLSYEELLQDTAGTLSRLIPVHTGAPVDPERIEATVRKFSFERQTGRTAGTEDRTSFRRKGVAGDWKNHFTQAAGRIFDRYCGDVLVERGFEKDRNWYESLPDR